MLSATLIEQCCSKRLVCHCSSRLVQRHHELEMLKEAGVLSLFEDQGRLYSSQGQDCPKTGVTVFEDRLSCTVTVFKEAYLCTATMD